MKRWLHIGFVVWLSGLAGYSFGQTTVSKTWSSGPTYVDNTGNYGLSIGTVTFVSGVDFPAGYVITDVNVTVNYGMNGNNNCTTYGGNSYPGEKSMRIDAPSATQVILAPNGFFSGSTSYSGINTVFDQDAGSALPSTPTTGTYRPNTGNLNSFDDESPFGSWTFMAGDNAGGDPMCINSFTVSITAQLGGSVSNTYSAGSISTEYGFDQTSETSSCPGAMAVNIPAGATITKVDVQYDMLAQGGAWKSEQRSQLRCVSTGGTDEASIYSGSGNVGGTQSYSRSGLTIANSVTGGGNINFELHAGRTWGGSGCNTTYNLVVNSTWTVTVYYVINCTPPAATSVSGGGTICNGGSATLTASGGAGGTIYWQNTTSGGTSTADASTSKVISAAGTYYFRSYNSADGGCWGPEGSATVTVVADPTSGNPSGGSICAGNTHAMSVSPSGGTGTFSYQWQSMASNCATPTNVGTNSSSYTTPALSAGTYYYRCVISQTGSGCNQITTTCATVTVTAVSVGGTVSSNAVCGSPNSGTVTLSGHTGSVLKWQYDDGGGWTDIANTTTSQNYLNLTVTTQYRAQVQNGGCAAVFSSAGTVTVDNTYPATPDAGSDQYVCGTTTTMAASGTGVWSVLNGTGTITSSSSPTSGITGMNPSVAVTFRWIVTNVACTASDDVVVWTQ